MSLNAVRNTLARVKPYNAIPGPRTSGWPLLGHLNLYLKKPHGYGKAWKNILQLKNDFLDSSDKIMKLNLPLFNWKHNGRVVVIFDEKDIEKVYKAEGKYPYRGNNMEAMAKIRDARPDVYAETKGLVMEDWQKWHHIRSKVQADLLRVESSLFYINDLQAVAQDFVGYIRQIRDEETKVIKDSLQNIYRYTFESICLVALDKRMGCLQPHMEGQIQEIFDASNILFKTHEELMTRPFWKWLPDPRWQKAYRDAQDSTNVLIDFGKTQVQDAIKKMATTQSDHDGLKAHMSVLQKLILANGASSPIPLVTAIDMMFAGIDTTGNTLSFLLYHLARNPEKQEKLRLECQCKNTILSRDDVAKAPYFHACLKESFRLTPTLPMQARMIAQDLVLQGYEIPANTFVMWVPNILGQDPVMFPEADKFIPERWLEKKINPLIVGQFGHGIRMCVGKRFAKLELLIAIHSLLTNFQINWDSKEDLTLSMTLINEPDQPMNFQFKDLAE